MLILALDTSGTQGSIAVLQDNRLVSEIIWQAKQSHTSELPQKLKEVLKETDTPLAKVDAFAVTVGPGSFTGIRVGLSFVKGLALDSKKPVVGVSTLSALAAFVREESSSFGEIEWICPLIDARREQIYGALFCKKEGKNVLVIPPQANFPRDFIHKVSNEIHPFPNFVAFLGTGVRRYQEEIEGLLGKGAVILPSLFDEVQASAVGKLVKELVEKGEFSKGGIDLLPLYLRASAAEDFKSLLQGLTGGG